jgi:hypothetical protein
VGAGSQGLYGVGEREHTFTGDRVIGLAAEEGRRADDGVQVGGPRCRRAEAAACLLGTGTRRSTDRRTVTVRREHLIRQAARPGVCLDRLSLDEDGGARFASSVRGRTARGA